MDWIDPRKITGSFDPAEAGSHSEEPKRPGKRSKAGGRKPKSLGSQMTAALAQPIEVWSEAFDQAVSQLKWPRGCTAESTFHFSAVIQEQAEVLVRAGMSAKKLAAVVASGQQSDRQQLSEVVGLMDQDLEATAYKWLDDSASLAHAALGVSALVWHIHEHAGRAGNEWLPQWLQAVTDRMLVYQADLDEAVLCHLVLLCELPLLLSVATAAPKKFVLAEASRAMDNLAEFLERGQDNPAPWLVHGATYLRASLACVLRCRTLANRLGMRKWYPPQQKSLVALLKHAARWSRPDGTQMLAATTPAPKALAVWDALAAQTRKGRKLQSAMSLAGIQRQFDDMVKAAKLPALTHYSDDAACVCMRSDWRHKGGQLALDFSEDDVIVEALGPKGQRVLSGAWSVRVERGGKPQEQDGDWSEVCWFSDEDVDYIELEGRFGEQARLQRQVVLFRADRVVMLADTLLCDEPGEWKVSSVLPVAPEAELVPAKKTTEAVIQLGPTNCLVMPLYLPEWRRQLADDGFSCEGGLATAQIHTHGKARAYMPTLISLCGSHAKAAYTWRQLTVGEDLRIVGRDEAVAFRVQFGADQRVIYRTLAPATRRTALGIHSMADFFACRFEADGGEADTLVEVEPSAANA